ncbi:amylo-alpha-1,6-glucosidase [Cohnella phaseoli]|uniref:Alpha-L-rhamnosidase-like protein n=1 Tax=Cohnella phaseoli TaxID=456490 RepID=A0A3D9IUJ7_9BACL|nr:amylo-alpha-1,6-glucosidase [Cohnella phaseoli]RED65438.1 alpha-L-rhamnosidase-like protein [Cohnella phaseoli]
MKTGFIFPSLVSADAGDGEALNVSSMLDKGESSAYLSVGGSRAPSVLLDFGIKTTGYFFVELEESSGDELVIQYGPLRDALIKTLIVPMPADGVLWVDEEYIALRYMKLSIRSKAVLPSPCQASIRRIGVKFSAYPCVYRGSFRATDPFWEKLWRTGAYTTQLCLQRSRFASTFRNELPEPHRTFVNEWRSPYSDYVIFDGPRRDREAWIGDIRTEALNIYYAFGANETVKSSLHLFHALQESSGLIPGSAASRQAFTEYNLWWIISIWEHYLFTEDRAFLDKMYEGYRSLMDWIEFRLDSRGFLYNDKTWMWTFPREGYGSATQCVLYRALQCAARIEEEAGERERVEALERLAAHLRRQLIDTYWDEDKGVFSDVLNLEDADVVLSDVNCYAVVFGLADRKMSERILSYLKAEMWTPYGSATLDRKLERAVPAAGCTHFQTYLPGMSLTDEQTMSFMWPHNKQIWPFMNGYEVEARFLADQADEALELTRRCWGTMLAQEPGTYWEMIDAENGEFPLRSFFEFSKGDALNSACHGWSGWISAILQGYALGVRPLRPGFRETLIAPRLGAGLTEIEGAIPTPHGPISVKIDGDERQVRLKVGHPEAVSVVYDFNSRFFEGKRILINGEAWRP